MSSKDIIVLLYEIKVIFDEGKGKIGLIYFLNALPAAFGESETELEDCGKSLRHMRRF